MHLQSLIPHTQLQALSRHSISGFKNRVTYGIEVTPKILSLLKATVDIVLTGFTESFTNYNTIKE